MQNERSSAQAWGLAAATRQLIETADPAEASRRTPQVDRAIAAFLAQPADSSAELNDAHSDQALILAHHFGVGESYFTDRGVADTVTAQRRERPEPWRAPHESVPGPRPAPAAAAGAGAGEAPDLAQARPRTLAGVALATTGLLVGAGVGGAVGYHTGHAAGRQAALAETSAHQPAREQHGPGGHQVAQADALRDAVSGLLPAVVQIRVHTGNTTTTGAGVVLGPDGILMTNDHVIAATGHGGQLTVEFQNGTSRPAHVIGRDPAADVAVIAADNLTGLTPIKLGNSDALHVGEQVVAVGSPLGPAGTVTRGVVSALNRAAAAGHDPAAKAPGALNAIQTDLALNPADSGGPLVDAHGTMIGIATVAPGVTGEAIPAAAAVAAPGAAALPAAMAGTGRTGYAIPINQATRIAHQLIDASRGLQPVLGVRVGITGHPAAPNEPLGAKIIAVVPGSPGGNAGLKAGDVVVRFDGHPVASGEEFIAVTRTLAAADTIQLSNGRSAHVVLPAHQTAVRK